MFWLAGPGDGRPPGPALCVSGGDDVPGKGQCPALERLGPDQRRLSRVSQDRAVRT